MRWLFLFLILPGLAMGQGNTVTTGRDAVSLVAMAAPVGGAVTLGLRFELAPGWHIYWSNPGDAGLAPVIELAAPAVAGGFAYPPPEFLLQGDVAAYVLSGDVVLPFRATGVAGAVAAQARWLVCSDICVPEHARFELDLTKGFAPGLFGAVGIVDSPFAARIAPDGTLRVAGLGPARVKTARFFPDAPGRIVNRAAQPVAFEGDALVLRLTPAPGFAAGGVLRGVLEVTDRSGAMQALRVAAAPGPAAQTALWVWLGLAFLGGLILNLMPCVFPILAMKALALARLGGQAAAKVRREALGYTAGVLCAFLLLALVLLGLRAAGAAVGWGFQFQSPLFVTGILLLIFAVGLNLAGVFELAGAPGLANALAGRGSFFTGALAVVVATPCTAPFMGGAVAAALLAGPAAGVGIFLSLGLGLAAPFLALGAAPGLAGLLPRPGRWMRVLQRALSVPMFATCIWLGWVVWHEAGTAKLSLPGAEAFSEARLAQLRAAGAPVFVDMTAAWCVTCLVNERTTLQSPAVRAVFAAHGVRVLVGDWTGRDAAITGFLQANHRDGVPLYVFYPAGGAGVVLPQILSPGAVEAAVE
jgi:thiol:disulfide interchange protein DsbD